MWAQPNDHMSTQKEKIEFIKQKLATDQKWALRGLITVYGKQTAAEKATEQTNEDNGVGFSGTDAEFLSSLAKQYLTRGSLSPKQMAYLHKRITKYARQLLRFSKPEVLDKVMGQTRLGV